MSLRPGSAPARLLLELWVRQGEGQRWTACWKNAGLNRLIELEYVSCHFIPSKGFRLTRAGQEAAQVLQASS